MEGLEGLGEGMGGGPCWGGGEGGCHAAGEVGAESSQAVDGSRDLGEVSGWTSSILGGY